MINVMKVKVIKIERSSSNVVMSVDEAILLPLNELGSLLQREDIAEGYPRTDRNG